jgi:hypothetical protein
MPLLTRRPGPRSSNTWPNSFVPLHDLRDRFVDQHPQLQAPQQQRASPLL